jgi:integrase
MAARRDRGQGGLTQRKDGRWQATLVVTLPNGNRETKYLYGRTKTEAKLKLDTARREKDRGELVMRAPTVETWLTTWLESRSRPPKPLKPKTWNGYESKIRVNIVPVIGRRRLDQLRPQEIDALYDHLRDRGLAESSVRQTHAILAKSLTDAVRKGVLGRSPMDRVTPPGTETNDRDQWTLEQAAHALRAAGESARWWLAIFYGMRQGEVLGLDWRHVDWPGHSFEIEQTVTQDYGSTALIFGTPKSKASRRRLPMVGQIETRLLLLWDAQGQPEAGLVFPSAKGTPRDPSRDYRDWQAFVSGAGLPRIALHAARNTAGSLMEAAGLPDRVVAQILGQAQVRTTHGYQRAELERIRGYLTGLGDMLAIES